MNARPRVLVMHAYSAANLGDGLLVEEAIDLIREAYGDGVGLTLVARDPVSFSAFPGTILTSLPSLRGVRQILTVARAVRSSDVVVGVGGGYARGDTASAFVKYAVVHLTQTCLAGSRGGRSVYLPQSIGPFHAAIWPVVRAAYRRIGTVALRDDRSVAESGLRNVIRVPDSAILSMERPADRSAVEPRPVLSVRRVSARGWARLEQLAGDLGDFDGYVQSATLGNDDRPETARIGATRLLEREDLMTPGAPPRVVIAVRLHAALMAIRNGHYVIHLAYERKGFGAFEDLGIPGYCHNVNAFDPAAVWSQAQKLLTSEAARVSYDRALEMAVKKTHALRSQLLASLRTAASAM